uniref:Pleckstrin homology domain-containing family M member 2 n=1 Tax=Anolis carolinensis TaxID=28377 RepID=H9GK51_ANOCA
YQPRGVDDGLCCQILSYFAACEDETPAIRNHDTVLQRLCEHLDHALLYGLQDLPSGYWVLVVHFTRREAVEQIELLEHVATNLGRSRAWLYLALNENSLESYLRLFQENLSLLHKYYVKNALVCSHDHLTLFLTLVSGLEFIRFDLDLVRERTGCGASFPHPRPRTWKPSVSFFRVPFVSQSQVFSLSAFPSILSRNFPYYDFGDVFPAVPSVPTAAWEDGDLTDTLSCPRSVTSELTAGRASAKSPPQQQQQQLHRYNPFNEKAEAPSSLESTPVHSAAPEKPDGTAAEGTDQSEGGTELEVIRSVSGRTREKPGKKKKARLEEAAVPARSAPEGPHEEEEDGGGRSGEWAERVECPVEPSPPQLGLCIPEMKDTSMERVGRPLSKVIDSLGDLGGGVEEFPRPEQPFRTDAEGPSPGGLGEGVLAPMDFYRFALESPNAPAASGGHHDPAGDGQPAHVPGGPEAAAEEGGGPGGGEAAGGPPVDEEPVDEDDGGGPKGGRASPSPSSAGDSGVDEGQGSPSEGKTYTFTNASSAPSLPPAQMIRMSTGHMEGILQLLFVLLTDCYIYLIRKGAAEKPYMVEEAVSYNELDYISVGLDQQTVTLVCTNRRKQFLLDTADATLTEFFLVSLKSAMIKGCREPPYPSILTDATMEKLALAKFVAQQSKREISDVVVCFYGLVHWEDPLEEALGPAPAPFAPSENGTAKEGVLSYKAGTNYLGKENWKPCFVVLSNGILYQYPDRTDVTPLLSINMGGEQCGGCRRSNTTERPHSFQVILTDRPGLELSAENEEEMADWMQYLCQAVSKGVIPQGVVPAPCVPCCLVLTEQKLFTCHEDCQTSFFRSLGAAELSDVASVSTEAGREYCLLEFAQDRKQFLPPWILYFSCLAELERFLSALDAAWRNTYQVELPHRRLEEASVRKKCQDALSLIHSSWQRSDSLCRGRASRDPWC